ncbi:MAG: NADH-quinone oxidoreductase subunit J [Desulfobacteraceae bacterium]|nr:NADH-quinone oxidoreductase subunit J [Desulfobacteraceae bacterium]
MTALRMVFYLLAILIVASTAMAITRKNLVHAVLYLVQSFFATAALFYLLGAPVLAALEIIIYAGAIMVLFLFIIMTLIGGYTGSRNHRQWIFPSLLGLASIVSAGVLLFSSPASETGLIAATASPASFGRYLFDKYWLPIEIVSLLLFVALVGALYLGTHKGKSVAQIEVEQ